MSNNLFRDTIDPGRLTVLIHCPSDRVGGLLRKSFEAIGCRDVHLVADAEAAVAAIDEVLPNLVVMVSDIADPAKLADAQRINRKRVRTDRRTPKVLGLMSPGIDDILEAKKAGFFDVLPLPITPNGLRDRLETVLTRMN